MRRKMWETMQNILDINKQIMVPTVSICKKLIVATRQHVDISCTKFQQNWTLSMQISDRNSFTHLNELLLSTRQFL